MKPVEKGYVQSGKANIYYMIFGDGSPLIFLHGNNENMKFFKNNVVFFAKQYKVILIDTRAHGKSSRGTEELNFTTLANDVFTVMDCLHVEKASVIGFSDGGNIALHMALLDGKRIDKMVLCGANLNHNGMKPTVRLEIYILYIKALFLVLIKMDTSTIEIINLMVNHPKLKARYLHRITAKTLVMAGENDMIKNSHTKDIADNVPDSVFIIIKGGDHFILRKKSNECNIVIGSFLEGGGKR